MDVKPLQVSEKVLKQFSPQEQYLLRPKKSVAVGLEAVIKFHHNQKDVQRSKNPFVSWTLNKIAVIERAWLDEVGNDCPIGDLDWWRVKIESETSIGQPMGCFIVRPLFKVERDDLAILAPSTWNQEQSGLTILLHPCMKPWMPWIIPKALRRVIMQRSGGAALVIPLEYPPKEELSNESKH